MTKNNDYASKVSSVQKTASSQWAYAEGSEVTVDGLEYKIIRQALRGHPPGPIYFVVGATSKWVREDDIDQ